MEEATPETDARRSAIQDTSYCFGAVKSADSLTLSVVIQECCKQCKTIYLVLFSDGFKGSGCCLSHPGNMPSYPGLKPTLSGKLTGNMNQSTQGLMLFIFCGICIIVLKGHSVKDKH